jgi:NitT/TauT family transport system permease protein
MAGATPARHSRADLALRIAAPAAMAVALLGLWEFLVRFYDVKPYILPGPLLIAQTLRDDWGTLSGALAVTLQITLAALVLAVVIGVALAVLFAQSKWIELTLFPYAVTMQVTPIVAIAPLIIIWVGIDRVWAALLICAWIVAFFPILSNTAVGLNSADHNLRDLFKIYRASRWQTLVRLRLPSALPFFLAGLRVSGGLALIGAVVAEFVAGTGGQQSGLAYRILEAGYRLHIARMFAALLLVSLTGIAIFAGLTLLSYLLLHRWHESAARRE